MGIVGKVTKLTPDLSLTIYLVLRLIGLDYEIRLELQELWDVEQCYLVEYSLAIYHTFNWAKLRSQITEIKNLTE
jgi:hypothetical protein